MKKYKHILFDLDHTLWDFEKNSSEALEEIFRVRDISKLLNCNFKEFYNAFTIANDELWSKYGRNEIDKEKLREIRFKKIFKSFGIVNDRLASKVEKEYLNKCPKKPHLIPFAIETLTYLKRSYSIHLLTNGFKKTQSTKIKNSGLESYFVTVTTSECCGFTKPQFEFFNYALKNIKCSPTESIMIGDNINMDIAGANNANIDTIFFNPTNQKHFEKCTFEVQSLNEIKNIL